MADAAGALAKLGAAASHSWLEQLTPDPETEKYAPNKRSRRVRSGHYIRLQPTPLPKPKLVIHSKPMAAALGIAEAEVESEAFVSFFSGEMHHIPQLQSWCTPYALSIMGEPQYRNCPFGDGTGYGDGRAVSVGEVVVDGKRWEMQLKGGGTTPFCRGADGRAVLRSSVREFLASEAMFHLGVETTRALSLIVSKGETTNRPWYSGQDDGHDPDIMITEQCAITTRVAPSFLRIGHIDLFARRALTRNATEQQKQEHRQIVEHALFREFPHIKPGAPLEERAEAMLDEVAERFAALVSGWLRVGFCQGNFNADNCLIGGRTMDYGPFGFIDKYDPLFAKWVGSGQHFAFMNQPQAVVANYATLVMSMMPLLGSVDKARPLIDKVQQVVEDAVEDTFRRKLGFAKKGSTAAAGLFTELERLMRRSDVDYTIFWRQLACVAELDEASAKSDAELFAPIRMAFYSDSCEKLMATWADLLRRWRAALAAEEGGGGSAAVAKRMRAENPKYIPREWMLVKAYDQAAHGSFDLVYELYSLFLKPYDEQPDFEEKYYRLAPKEALQKGGIGKMT